MALASILVVLSMGAVAAQPTLTSSEPRKAQFVFVIDDSGSMARTDPDRLAIFAVQSLINMLDDRDEASVVRLNGPHDGAPPPPIAPLARSRGQLLDLLALDKTLAGYQADNTRCRTALAATQRLLEDAYRPEVAQVVMFLTDGECTPAKEEQPDVDAFLGGLRSHRDRRFQFYLLLFQGASASPGIAELAAATRGDTFPVGGADPTAILYPFASALSRSQGYKSYLLDPRSARLAAHRGAERVRLLAVAPGQGPPLQLSIQDQKGNAPRLDGTPRSGTHRYRDGRSFRFTALDYRPGVEPVTVAVAGAGASWRVVAIPEYRLAVRTRFLKDSCDVPGSEIRFGADTGSTVCVLAELVDGAGQVVGGDVDGGDLKAFVRVARPGQPAPPVELPANQLPGDRARFGLLRQNLERGDYELTAGVILDPSSEDALHLSGRPMLLAVSSLVIIPRPDRFDFGMVHPGDSVLRPLVFGGSFQPLPARLSIRDRDDLPACISVELGGVAEGRSQAVRVDQRYNLALRVAPYCGPQPFRRSIDTVVRLDFVAEAAGRQLPVVELPIHFAVDYDIRVPPQLTARVKAGEAADLPLRISGNFSRDVHLRATVAEPGEAGGSWPKDAADLELGFAASAAGRLQRRPDGQPLREREFSLAPATAGGTGAESSLRLLATPDRCCEGGSYRTTLGLAASTAQPRPRGAPTLAPILIPIEIQVVPAGVWTCYGPRLLAASGLLLVLLLALYAFSMVRNSSFLKADILAAKLKPLVWTGWGEAVEQKSSGQEVLRLATRALSPGARMAAWLRANPFRFGLPGGAYRETVELTLQPHRDIARSQMTLRVEPDLLGRMTREPAAFGGQLFATALGGVTFLAVPDGAGRIVRLVRQDTYEPTGAEEGPPRIIKLRRVKLLKPLDERQGYVEDGAAGWQVG